MADSILQAFETLRAKGVGPFLSAAVSRVTDLATLPLLLSQMRREGDLQKAISRVAGAALRPGSLIFAMQKPTEVAGFLQHARDIRPRVVVEIGTAAGGMLYLLSRIAAADSILVSIDLPGGSFGGGYARWRAPIYRRLCRPGQRVHLLRGSSHSSGLREAFDRLLDRQAIDLLFIDGDHSYIGARSDFCYYGSRVRSGGIIALHDIAENPADHSIEVPKLWSELRQIESAVGIEDPNGPPGYGIGMVWRHEAWSFPVDSIENTSERSPERAL